ncbi:alpha/beta fold hydrolase [Ramlibacter sp. G-1-2-2]|uniref:Alpha/beta fold hydrolase n=1 Tax=Ramlibacter agri TaxID=2728837 RepID=A0A848HB61_9BURK|nr:alpha/beta fold hydrolase [Ramlibacter agri]NML48266.1 alpha/beta fold hydrolase [Ramlibacter agri]
MTMLPAPRPSPEPLDLPLKAALARWAHGISPASVAMAYADWLSHIAVSPSKQAELASSALRNWLTWLQAAGEGWNGDGGIEDKRFAPPEWRLPPYAALAQAFLLSQQWWDEAATGVRGVARHHEEVTAFMARQWLDMLSPSNFPLLNPQVLRATAASNGANLATGWSNWLRDAMAVSAGGQPRGVEAFRPGEAVALTPGKVVHRNRLMELIQYEPATPSVRKEPVLVVPSWIMKFYILDLTPDDSLVKYLVDQGHTVFMVSWHNPGPADRDLGLDDYVELGVLDALHAVQALRPHAGIHAAGYCLGGTLLAIAAALLGARHQHPLKTVSLLAAQVDFEQPGELGLFMDESQVAFLEDLMAERGYLDGREMAGAFQLINSKDLVWSKLVHEYLMGAQTPMTALRAWNADATRMPARMHSEYLRRLYMENELAEGDYTVRGEHVSLDRLRVPLFVAATERDHVSPWRSVYRVLRLARAPARFVLVSGGHNAGIVSPPDGPAAHQEAGYRYADHGASEAPADAQRWFAAARAVRGSWWTNWNQWLQAHGDGTQRAQAVTAVAIAGQVIAAPGTYVFGT